MDSVCAEICLCINKMQEQMYTSSQEKYVRNFISERTEQFSK